MDRVTLAALIIVGIVVGYVVMKNYSDGPIALSPGGESASLQAKEISEVSDTYEINARYPQFGVPEFDASILSGIQEAIGEIKRMPAPDASSFKNSLTTDFADAYIGPSIVSVKLILTQYTGGAHPMTIIAGLNYSRESKTMLTLDDALSLTGLTIDQLSKGVTAQLKAKLGNAVFEEGANTNPENFSSFAISSSTVTFIFQPYQVAAYAAGPQEVSFTRIK